MNRKPVPVPAAPPPAPARLRALLADPARVAAARDAWRALWVSRALVWVAGLAGVLAVGRSGRWQQFDPASLTAPFGSLGDVLVAPAARWDAVWYLAIALDGYGETTRTAFYPLYPLLVRAAGAPAAAVGDDRGAYLLAGIAVSFLALAAGLYVVRRLAALEVGEEAARTTTWLVALFPTAFAFSAVYTESLFLALSAGSIYAGRRGSWRCAGVLGLLAAATRSTGVLLVVPLALLYLYGPRADGVRRQTTRGWARGAPGGWARGARARVRPRYALRADAAWIALVPAGLAAYVAYLAAATGDPWTPFTVQEAWYREFAGPLGGAWDGIVAAWAGVRQLASGARDPVYFSIAAGDPYVVAVHNIGNLAFLAAAAVALVGALRRLPFAYAAWGLLAVALPLSYPVGPEPLASLPRYLAVAFPLQMWLAAWATERGRARAVAAVSAALLAALTVPFAAWEWVA